MKQNSVAVIGCGYWGKNLVRVFYELGSLAAISDPVESTAQAISSQYKVPARSWGEILSDSSIKGVVIASPAIYHCELCCQAIEAGKDVYVEKPLALKVDEAKKIKDVLQKSSSVLMVGHLLQYHPAIEKIKSLISNNEIGDLMSIRMHRFNLGKIRHEENVLWSFAPHDFSVISSIVKSKPIFMQAVGQSCFRDDIEDRVDVIMKFESGVHAEVCVSWLHPIKEQKMVFVGSKAMLVFDDTLPIEQKLAIYPHEYSRKNSNIIQIKHEPIYQKISSDEPLKLECQHFLDCIKTRQQPRTDINEGIEVVDLLQKAQESLSKEKIENFFVHESSYVDKNVVIGKGTKIWHFSHILGGTKLGENCVIGQNVMIGPDVSVGNNCKIQNNVSLYKGIILEEGVFCGPSCVFTNVLNPRATIERKNEFLPTHVKKNATIGANATIVCGSTLGEGCLVGAGCVVTKNVPDYACVVGNPARIIGWRCECGVKLDKNLHCNRCESNYILSNGQLTFNNKQ